MIEIVPAEPHHLADVLANPSRQMLADLAAVDLPMDRVVDRFNLDGAVAGLEDGETRSVMGWDKLPGVWYCWSATTPEYYDPRRPAMILATRRYLRRLQDENPGVSLLMVPRVPVDDRFARWMDLLGWMWLPNEGVFVYKRRLT